MPHQQLIADVGGELIEDEQTGLMVPAYRSIVALTPRQAGKTLTTLAFMLQRALLWNTGQRIAYSAQTGFDARRKLLDDHVPLIEGSPLAAAIRKVQRAQGNEGILFRTGARIDVIASSESAAHGRSLNFVVVDEAMADTDDRREQAMLPAMATKRDAQMLIVSTAGTDASVFLRRKVEAGRAAVEANDGRGIAYFEWSAGEDADPDDERDWWRYMPSLGRTITPDVVRHARASMSDSEFRRSFMNQWTNSDERVIPAGAWDAVCDGRVAPEGRLVFGLDVSPDRTTGAIVVADHEGRCELIDARDGVSWIVERAVEVATRWNAPLVLDSAGPAATFGDAIEAAGVTVERYSSRQMFAACAAFFDAVLDRKVRIRSDERLDRATASAGRRISGDSWLWSRRNSSSDVAPLVALTLAFDRSTRMSVRDAVPQMYFFGGDGNADS